MWTRKRLIATATSWADAGLLAPRQNYYFYSEGIGITVEPFRRIGSEGYLGAVRLNVLRQVSAVEFPGDSVACPFL